MLLTGKYVQVTRDIPITGKNKIPSGSNGYCEWDNAGVDVIVKFDQEVSDGEGMLVSKQQAWIPRHFLKINEPSSFFRWESIPIQSRCRWFVQRGATTKFDRGFRSKQDANNWINSFTNLDWRAGFVFRLRGDNIDMSIVDRNGVVATN